MARTSLQIIAESLAKRHGLTQKEAERFGDCLLGASCGLGCRQAGEGERSRHV